MYADDHADRLPYGDTLFPHRYSRDFLLRGTPQDKKCGGLWDKSPLTEPPAQGDYPPLARKLDMTENALRVAVHRLRQRYRALLRAEIARTVENPAAVDDEIRELFAALSRFLRTINL
jgi:hypothetical protein